MSKIPHQCMCQYVIVVLVVVCMILVNIRLTSLVVSNVDTVLSMIEQD